MASRIAVATRVSAADPKKLIACLDSVERQSSSAWQHIIVVDGAPGRRISSLLDRRAARDERVVVIRRPSRGAPADAYNDAYNDALAAADAPLFMLLGQHDLLTPDAVAELGVACASGTCIAYGDHEVAGIESSTWQPYYKPDFSPELLRSTSYIHRPLVAPRELVQSVGGFRSGFEGALDHDLALRLTEAADDVAHVPHVLYRERGASTRRSGKPATQPPRPDAGRRAVAEHCARVGISASVDRTDHDGCYRVRRVPEAPPLVSVIIPTRGSSGSVWGVSLTFVISAVESIATQSSYQHLEFVVVYDEATPRRALQALRRVAGDRVRLVPFADDFNFSAKINVGAAAATGEHLLLLNDDTQLIDPDSIAVMVAHLGAADVGMVGAKLLFADGTLQHGGHVYNRTVGHACTGWPGDSPGPWPLRPLAVERECSGVTAAAALVRRDVFDAVGGFATELPLNYNDVDFSLKIRAAGHRIIWTPHASWYHFESRTRHSVLLPEEVAFVNDRWDDEINNDPYCNPNIQLDRHDWFERPTTAGRPTMETGPSGPTSTCIVARHD